MGRFIHVWDDAYLYEREYKDKLNITNPRCREIILSAHGIVGAVIINQQNCSVFDLLNIFQFFVPNLHEYKYIRLAFCYSAKYHPNSLAGQLSIYLQNHYIKGYVEYIEMCCQPDYMNNSIRDVGIIQAGNEMADLLLEERFVRLDRSFHSVIYYRGQIMRQKMQTPEGLLRL